MAAIANTDWETNSAEGVAYSYISAADLPSSATTVYTKELDFLAYDSRASGVQGVVVEVQASAVSGTNIDINVLGAREASTAEAFTLPGLSGAAQITGTDVETFKFDLKEYPMPYFYISVVTDANESANTLTIRVHYK